MVPVPMVIGRDVAVIDPGPLDDAHMLPLEKAGGRDSQSYSDHTHPPRPFAGGSAFSKTTGAPTYGYGPHGGDRGGPKVEEGGDYEFVPDHVIKDGDVIVGNGWSFEAIHTPGHTSNHVCFALREENAIFSGDHVMGWSTSVISPPDGNMADYMKSLQDADTRGRDYWPTHGPPITEPKAHVEAFITHRNGREDAILQCISEGRNTIPDMVEVMHADVDRGCTARPDAPSLRICCIWRRPAERTTEGAPSPDGVYAAA